MDINEEYKDSIIDVDLHKYDKLKETPEITRIFNNMPQGLTELEKAYYVYLELGKILSQSIPYVHAPNPIVENDYYNQDIDESFYGICKSISELYACILKDPRIGVDCDVVIKNTKKIGSHVDTVLNIENEHYIVNLIGDLYRIKTSKRIRRFGFEVSPAVENMNEEYITKLEKMYGKLSHVSKNALEQMDIKLGYSYYNKAMENEDSGVYTEDIIRLVHEELTDENKYKKYILKGKKYSEVDILKCKLDFVFDCIKNYTDFNRYIKTN